MTQPITNQLAFFRLECARAALTLEQSQQLEQRILGVLQSDVLPEVVSQTLRGAPLLEIPWLASGFGVDHAATNFEVMALGILVTGQILRLEQVGVVSPSVRASFEYGLGHLLPNSSALAMAGSRDRLRAVLNSSPQRNSIDFRA